MTKREQILIHEAGHLLYFLKSLENPKNLVCVESIEIGLRGGFFILDLRKIAANSERSSKERFLTGLGGMITDIYFHKLSYKQFIYASAFNHGWIGDIKNIEFNGVNWGEQRLLAWKLAKSFTKEDELFVNRIVSLFRGEYRVTLDKMLPAIRKRFTEHKNTYSKNEQLKLF